MRGSVCASARRRPHASDAVAGHGVRRAARDGSPNQPCPASQFAILVPSHAVYLSNAIICGRGKNIFPPGVDLHRCHERLSGVRPVIIDISFGGGGYEVSVPDLRRREDDGQHVEGPGRCLHGRVFRLYRGHQRIRAIMSAARHSSRCTRPPPSGSGGNMSRPTARSPRRRTSSAGIT